MARDYQPDEFLDPSDVRPDSRPRENEGGADPGSRGQGPASDPQNDGRFAPQRAPEQLQARSVEARVKYEFRHRTYRLRASEMQTLGELGKFRAIATDDLEEFAYDGKKGHLRPDVASLIRQGLIAEKIIPHAETAPRHLLTLTKRGHQLLASTSSIPKNQALYHGFTKPREAHHDADLYRLYHKAAENIERQGGKNLRVILDYELKKRLYRDLAQAGADRNSPDTRKDIAEKHGLHVVRGKIPIPDVRIEYETQGGEMGRVDLELATEHYRGSNLAEKVRAGFSLYAQAQDAPGLRRVLDQLELTAEILSL